jgi:hypothetical protein
MNETLEDYVLRPGLIFSEADADLFVAALDSVLAEDPAQPA